MYRECQKSLERRLYLRHVSKSFGRNHVLRSVSLQVCPGQIMGLIGANGSGKTTLLRIVLGLVRHDAGRLTINGVAPGEALGRFRATYFASGRALPDHVRVRQWAGLFTRTGPLMLDRRRIRVLSRGQRQLVGLKATLAKRAFELVILDEPWEGLDPQGAEWLAAALVECRRRGAMILVSSHRLTDLAGVCDAYAFLHQGRLTMVAADDLCRSTLSVADRLRTTYMALSCTGSGS